MRKISTLALAGVLCVAGWAAAQNADQNTAGPSKNQLKLRLTEPREGAQISGSTIRVAVDYNTTIFGAGQGTKFGEKNFPMPLFDVYVDNTLKQTLKGGESNVAVIEGIPPGRHKVVVMAKNISNEIIDRAEVNVTNTEATVSSTVAPAPAPAETTTYSSDTSAPAPPPPSAPVRSYATDTTPTRQSDTLPTTGSTAPDAAVLGLALVAGGLWIARRAR
ncbi:MAG TPA: LPXTG cell wall anchor domain-containing protein [Thermoanaerobaculia bacterium]|nr:LPXTG cell wall anchor domain-containing protein [Thermoanaerobaculia bacterium]